MTQQQGKHFFALLLHWNEKFEISKHNDVIVRSWTTSRFRIASSKSKFACSGKRLFQVQKENVFENFDSVKRSKLGTWCSDSFLWLLVRLFFKNMLFKFTEIFLLNKNRIVGVKWDRAHHDSPTIKLGNPFTFKFTETQDGESSN